MISALLGCRRDEPLEKLPAPAPAPALVVPLRPPPPPPPPPPEAELIGPPDELAAVLAEQDEPAVVQVFELTEGRARSTLLGHGIKRAKRLEPSVAAELVARLARDDAFVDGGDYGCVGDPLGLNISRGAYVREVVVDCGHVYFTASRHDGRFALLAPELNEFIYRLR